MTYAHNPIVSQLKLTRREYFYLFLLSAFFAALPTRVFIAISSDVIQFAVIIIPFVVAFMTIMVSIDITFGLPIPTDALARLSERRRELSTKLLELLRFSLALIVVGLIAKSLAVWFGDCGWVAALVNRFAAWTVGGLVAILMIKIGDIRNIYGYLSAGADIALHVRAQKHDGL